MPEKRYVVTFNLAFMNGTLNEAESAAEKIAESAKAAIVAAGGNNVRTAYPESAAAGGWNSLLGFYLHQNSDNLALASARKVEAHTLSTSGKSFGIGLEEIDEQPFGRAVRRPVYPTPGQFVGLITGRPE